MNKMTVIQLLNKIANGEEVPTIIKYDGRKHWYNEIEKDYYEDFGYDYEYLFKNLQTCWLNDEVEILEEEPRDIEVCGSWFTKSEYDKLAHNEEPKRIPEKIEEPRFNKGRYYIKDINGDDSEISGIERTFRLKINEIIDYLESKGDE